ncbi:hypothetical protein HYH03_018464 [Edaphochlamys debaryana]|uniref:ABC transporter domain-containing protein n=1 Tax=Edaphochlamys debaryana TaxID=47281 RepID=A0A836BNA0_9CHLO|nr:hypothetical protein HYH03_018464 [Edaphochlamys debaryana]|eukprot:KAG2482622.1 hypothetical protein HYH03_018464 [Edaphochlamys debaryana]
MDVETGAVKASVDPDASEQSYRKEKSFAAQGMRIIFKDLDYHVPSNTQKGERAFLLKKVAGVFEAHQMAALMGPSGSGKTTLLDVLAGRKNAGVTEGTIAFAGQKPTPQFLRRYTGYVEQFDTLIPTLTVYEMLLYTAELKRPMREPLDEKRVAVEDLLKTLQLERCRDVMIGNAMAKGISGGQAKRTNIGIALITNPRVLFLDEPTSGLDSFTANEVMTVVKELAGSGVTICATIHSPTSYCFSLFDSLIMLVKGRVVYFGPRGHSAIEFARSACPHVKEYLPGYNDAEYLVDLVTEADQKGKSDDFADHYESSALCKENLAKIDSYLSESADVLPEHIQKELAVRSATVTPWWWGLKTLIKYRSSKNFKDPAFLGPRIGDKIFIGLLVMTLYLGIGDNLAPDNLVNIAAVMFMWCTLPAFGASAYVPALVLERGLFTRERSDGLYLVITYLLSRLFDELVLACLCSLGVSAFVFFGIQLQGQWVVFWLIYWITLSNGIVLAYFIAAISPNLDVANALLPTYVVTLLFFGGFLFRFSKIPPWWKWYSYIDFLRYAWGAVMVNQFEGERNVEWMGTTVLNYYSLGEIDKWAYMGYLSLFFIVFFLLALVTMQFKKYSSR